MSQRSNVVVNYTGAGLGVAVVGAGPSGLYAVRSLLESVSGASIDVFDRLPTPYGLVRYGVAPDNQKMKSVIRVLRESFDDSNNVRFFGNVTFGEDITRADLHDHYDAVIYATGTQGDRQLGIPGEDLPGSYGAKEFVNWYCGHPDAAKRQFPLHGAAAAVVGAGNVALDVVRMLAKSVDEISVTDVPDRVLNTFRGSQITDIYMFARRGPAQAKFTPVELREMGELINADIIIDPNELELTVHDEENARVNRRLRNNLTMLQEWATRPLSGKPRRVHMRFLRSPVRILGDKEVTGIVVERNKLYNDGTVVGSGEHETLDIDTLFRAVGYQAQPLTGVPFDAVTSTIPQHEGRVLDESGNWQHPEYVTGWAKRGPTGVIGTNKNDAAETVHSLLEDLQDLTDSYHHTRSRAVDGGLTRLLDQRGIDYVDWASWMRLDTYETEAGAAHGRPRVKVPDSQSMLTHAHRTTPQREDG